jgi:hypothetical protein
MAHNLETLFTTSSDPILVRPMSHKETEDFTTILLMEFEPRNREHFPICKGKDIAHIKPFEGEGGLLAIFVKRLQFLTPEFEYDPLTVILLATLCNSPGKIVMWVFTLAKATKELGAVITPSILSKDYLPWGVPTEARQRELWDAQKNLKTEDGKTTDNYIDSAEAWAWAN